VCLLTVPPAPTRLARVLPAVLLSSGGFLRGLACRGAGEGDPNSLAEAPAAQIDNRQVRGCTERRRYQRIALAEQHLDGPQRVALAAQLAAKDAAPCPPGAIPRRRASEAGHPRRAVACQRWPDRRKPTSMWFAA
jgi:hypothetical protein